MPTRCSICGCEDGTCVHLKPSTEPVVQYVSEFDRIAFLEQISVVQEPADQTAAFGTPQVVQRGIQISPPVEENHGNDVIFCAGTTEILRICEDGRVLYREREIANESEIINGLREFLQGAVTIPVDNGKINEKAYGEKIIDKPKIKFIKNA